MTYCHTSHMTDRYCDALGEATAISEAFAETEEYKEALEAFGGSEEEFWDSEEFASALEAYEEWETEKAWERYYEV